MTQPFFKRYRLPIVGGGLVALAVGLASYLTGVSDLRPPGLTRGISEASAERGRTILAEMERAHGGVAAWKAQKTGRFVVKDDWTGISSVASPWPNNPGRVTITTHLASDNARMEIEGGETWGVQHWLTYSVGPDSAVVWDAERNFDRWFWVPTVTYFVEAPYRLGEAEIVADAGPAEFDGMQCDRVFLTWGSPRPDRDIDQYIAWIDKKDRRLRRLDYTVRDFAGFMTSSMVYSDYREVAGFPIAHSIAGDHAMTLEKVELGVKVPDSVVLPDPSRRGAK